MINADIPWGQQVAVMFQIVSTLMADVPGFALVMMELRGMQPHVCSHAYGRYLEFTCTLTGGGGGGGG